MGIREQMEAIYGRLPLDQIPWNITGAPDLLADMVRTGRLEPCDAIDLGCGAGNAAVWLAEQGFRVTGVDISSQAIELATRSARTRGADCTFVEADLTGDLSRLASSFDFGYDWEVLHHVFPPQRRAFAENIRTVLRPGARHLSVCFAEEDPSFGGGGKFRRTPLDTTLYFSSLEEIGELYAPLFRVLELNTKLIAGKYGTHMAIVALLQRE
jgi:SAM-dependent methyltransferase